MIPTFRPRNSGIAICLFERSEFLIDTSPPKNPSVCVCVRLILVLAWKKIVLFLVWGTYYVPYIRMYLVPSSASSPIAGSALPPVGRATPLLR